VAKISAAVKEDKEGLQVINDANGAMIFPLERGETHNLQKLKLDYIKKTFFDKDSKEYSGISEKEYKIYKEILRHIDELERVG
jgi:Holliday junction resolvase RusA-like endonuclease